MGPAAVAAAVEARRRRVGRHGAPDCLAGPFRRLAGGAWRACTRSWPRHASFSDSVSTSACRSAVFCVLGALITPSRPRGCGPAPAVAGLTASATCAEGAASPASSPAAPLGPRLRMQGLMAPFASLHGRNGRAAIVWSAAHPASQVCPLASGSVDKQAVSCQRLRGRGGRVAPSRHGASARLPALWHPARGDKNGRFQCACLQDVAPHPAPASDAAPLAPLPDPWMPAAAIAGQEVPRLDGQEPCARQGGGRRSRAGRRRTGAGGG